MNITPATLNQSVKPSSFEPCARVLSKSLANPDRLSAIMRGKLGLAPAKHRVTSLGEYLEEFKDSHKTVETSHLQQYFDNNVTENGHLKSTNIDAARSHVLQWRENVLKEMDELSKLREAVAQRGMYLDETEELLGTLIRFVRSIPPRDFGVAYDQGDNNYGRTASLSGSECSTCSSSCDDSKCSCHEHSTDSEASRISQ